MNIFEKFEDDFLKFDEVRNKRSTRPDVHAFIMLSEMFPSETGADLICSSGHDEIYIDVSLSDLTKAASEDEIRDLIRCGVREDSGYLCMFV